MFKVYAIARATGYTFFLGNSKSREGAESIVARCKERDDEISRADRWEYKIAMEV